MNLLWNIKGHLRLHRAARTPRAFGVLISLTAREAAKSKCQYCRGSTRQHGDNCPPAPPEGAVTIWDCARDTYISQAAPSPKPPTDRRARKGLHQMLPPNHPVPALSPLPQELLASNTFTFEGKGSVFFFRPHQGSKWAGWQQPHFFTEQETGTPNSIYITKKEFPN